MSMSHDRVKLIDQTHAKLENLWEKCVKYEKFHLLRQIKGRKCKIFDKKCILCVIYVQCRHDIRLDLT